MSKKSHEATIVSVSMSLFFIVSLGCGREFSPPPDKLTVNAIEPNVGFLDTVVNISGTNFDPVASNNLVFFGNTPASILAASSNELRVKVPVLNAGDSEPVTVSAPMGQGTSPVDFHYLGAGHPIEEKISKELSLESGPSTVSMFLPSARSDNLVPALITNTASGSISFMDLVSGWQLSFGVPGQPSSGVILPFEGLQESDDDTNWPSACWSYLNRYLLFLTTIQNSDNETLKPDLVQYAMVVAFPNTSNDSDECRQSWISHGAKSASFAVAIEPIPEPLKINVQNSPLDDPPFMPGEVRSACLDLQSQGLSTWSCQDFLLVVTDLYRPVMSLFLYSKRSVQYSMVPLGTVILSNNDSYCLGNEIGDRLGKIQDIAHKPASLDFNVLVENRPEIWEVKLKPENDGFVLDTANLIWPEKNAIENYLNILQNAGWDLTNFSLNEICSQNLSAITTSTDPDRSRKTLFLSSNHSNRIFEMVRFTLPNDTSTIIPRRTISLDSHIFSVQTAMGQGLDGIQKEWLYTATANGLTTIEIGLAPSTCTKDEDCPEGLSCTAFMCESEPMRILDFLSLPGSIGKPNSLAKYGLSLDEVSDTISLADTTRNQIVTVTAGKSLSGSRPIMVGNTRPQVAISQFDDFIYLTNPLDNSIQVIDMNTGIQKSKFSIHDGNSFGATDMMCIHDSGEDLLLIPIANDYMSPDLDNKTFDNMVLRKVNGLGQISSLGILKDPGLADDSSLVDTQAHDFNEIIPSHIIQQDKINDALFFVQYPKDENTQGLIWPAAVSASQDMDSMLVDGDGMREWLNNVDPEPRSIPPRVTIVRLDPDAQFMAFWEPVVEGANNDVGRISLYPVDDHLAAASMQLSILPPDSTIVTDIAVLARRGFVRMFFALPQSGKILEIRSYLDGTNHDQKYIQVSGAPEKMSFSPDGRRLFVTHSAGGKLTVVDTDCLPTPTCDDDSECEAGRNCHFGFCVPQSCTTGALCSSDSDCNSEEEKCYEGACTSESGESRLCPEGTICDPSSSTCTIEFCETVSSNLSMNTSSKKVVFSPGGDKALVTHHNSNRITIIE